MKPTTHIVCYSGGHSSALVAIAVAQRFGKDSTVLLNHDINANVEDADIKRFKEDIASHLGIPITYANIRGLILPMIPDQFDVVVEAGAFKVGTGTALCTARLKTEPFIEHITKFHPDKNCVAYYGFDASETVRIQRRSSIMGNL